MNVPAGGIKILSILFILSELKFLIFVPYCVFRGQPIPIRVHRRLIVLTCAGVLLLWQRPVVVTKKPFLIILFSLLLLPAHGGAGRFLIRFSTCLMKGINHGAFV
jgi:hypothetical protein